jgi:hypothetical protein
MIEKASTQIMFKRSEVYSIGTMVIKVLKLADFSLEFYKYIAKVLISVIKQQNTEHITLLMSLAIKLRGLLTSENSFYNGLLIYTILNAASIVYEMPLLKEFVLGSVSAHLIIEPYFSLFTSTDEFSLVLKHKRSVFSKHENGGLLFSAKMFDFETALERKSDFRDMEEDDNDDEFLGLNHSDTEFSSISSHELQERVIDLQEIRPEITESDYNKLLSNQEEQDRKFLEQIST